MQMWELNNNGTLKSSYSGLCASVYNVKGDGIESNYWFQLMLNIMFGADIFRLSMLQPILSQEEFALGLLLDEEV